MERSDFLKEAFRFGILAQSAQRQVLSDLPCLYTPVYIHLYSICIVEPKKGS
nr:MAG TPA: hypothetical protein [Microviridae sp.]